MAVRGVKAKCAACEALRKEIKELRGTRDLFAWRKRMNQHWSEEHDRG